MPHFVVRDPRALTAVINTLAMLFFTTVQYARMISILEKQNCELEQRSFMKICIYLVYWSKPLQNYCKRIIGQLSFILKKIPEKHVNVHNTVESFIASFK